MTSEFSDRPLVAGSLTGIRAYRVDGSGLLTGINFRQVVKHGENQAVCRSTGHALHLAMRRTARQMYGLPPETEAPGHVLVSLGCTCGFYAYFDGSNDYMTAAFSGGPDQPKVEAIIEGYGKVVVGSRGFRAEKLRLVAFIRADAPEQRTESRLDRVARWLGARPRTFWTLFLACIVAALGATGLGVVYSRWWYAAEVALLVTANVGQRLYRRGWRQLMEEHIARLFGRSPAPSAEDWQRIRAAYPDVPVYTSRKAALAEHPLTVPEDAS